MISEEIVIAHIESHVANFDDAINHLCQLDASSKRNTAERRWQVYLLVLARDAVSGIVALLRVREYRSAVILFRSIFEYRIKAEYLINNRREAYRQFQLIMKRVHADLSKLKSPDDLSAAHLVGAYLEWCRTAGKLVDDYSGDIGPSKMSLAVATDLAVDSAGNRYSPEFVHKYGIPSWTIHADGAGMVSVFPGFRDDKDWDIRKADDLYDFAAVALPLLHTVFDHLRCVRIYFKLNASSLETLALRSVAIRDAFFREWKGGDG